MLGEIRRDCKRSGRLDAVVYMFFYRLGNKIYYSNISSPIRKILILLVKIPKKLLNLLYNCEIPFSARIGAGVKIPHLNGIVIHWKAIIGENCTIYHQTTIGANEHSKDCKLCPHIGDRVYIGAGSKIIGNINISSDVRIGANAVVTKDVKSNMTVVGFNKQIYTKSEINNI